jgi:hypothetical protein
MRCSPQIIFTVMFLLRCYIHPKLFINFFKKKINPTVEAIPELLCHKKLHTYYVNMI